VVEAAIRTGRPVVGLESSVFAQGLPAPHNAEAAKQMDAAICAAGAVPAITAIVRGQAVAGLAPDELSRFLSGTAVGKASARDLAPAIAGGRDASTTVAASLLLCWTAGIQVFATGGIGGVHRAPPFDESADLIELARTPMIVVCAGAKSVLDSGYHRTTRTQHHRDRLSHQRVPGFHYASTGFRSTRQDDVDEVVATVARRAQPSLRRRRRSTPPPEGSAAPGVKPQSTPPFQRPATRPRATRAVALSAQPCHWRAHSRGELALLSANARLAAELSVQLARGDDS
jgi:pseudouridine-5'-phosphate glycosidase